MLNIETKLSLKFEIEIRKSQNDFKYDTAINAPPNFWR